MRQKICIDTETGGFSATKNGLCSITLKVVHENTIKTIFIKPNKDLYYNSEAMTINGLSMDFLEKNGVSEYRAVMQILLFIHQNFDELPIILGHNIAFDIRFLNALFERHSENFEQCFEGQMDTMKAMRQLRTEGKIDIENVKLNTCYKHFFGTDIENAHTSEGDVIATEKIYNKIEELIDEI